MRTLRYQYLLVLALLLPFTVRAQPFQRELLLGSWVKTDLRTKAGDELPITFRSKRAYLRFSFAKGGHGFRSIDFKDKGLSMPYSLKNHTLVFGINTYAVELLDSTRLVLTEEARTGYAEPAVRYTFVRENHYQDALPAAHETAVHRRGHLVYKESEKLTPELQTDVSLEDFLSRNMSTLHESAKENNFFVASFVVLPSGRLDTIQIYKGRNTLFDRQFTKAIAKTDGLWKAARLDGQPVAVEKEIKMRFFTFATKMEYDDKYRTGLKLQQQGEYEAAILFFTACIKLDPEDEEPYYHRASCFKASGHSQQACADWQHVKALGSHDADEWLSTFCQ